MGVLRLIIHLGIFYCFHFCFLCPRCAPEITIGMVKKKTRIRRKKNSCSSIGRIISVTGKTFELRNCFRLKANF